MIASNLFRTTVFYFKPIIEFLKNQQSLPNIHDLKSMAIKNEKNRSIFKEKSAVDIEISTRILTLKNQDLAIFNAKMIKIFLYHF